MSKSINREVEIPAWLALSVEGSLRLHAAMPYFPEEMDYDFDFPGKTLVKISLELFDSTPYLSYAVFVNEELCTGPRYENLNTQRNQGLLGEHVARVVGADNEEYEIALHFSAAEPTESEQEKLKSIQAAIDEEEAVQKEEAENRRRKEEELKKRTINQQIDDLLLENFGWEYVPEQPEIWVDGILDEAVWREQQPKILFLLAEPNAQGGRFPERNLRKVLLSDSERHKKQFHRRLAMLTRFLTTGEESDQIDNEEVDEMLRKVAVANLKKTDGTSQVEGSIIGELSRNRPVMMREIELIAPDIIVACGKHVEQALPTLFPYGYGNVPIYMVPHPSARIATAEFLAAAKENQLWKKRKSPSPA